MARYDHLQLVRLPEQLERRRPAGVGDPPVRDPAAHVGKLRAELDRSTAEQQRRRRPEFVDPSLILRVRMRGMALEADWESLGLTLIASDPDKILVLFADNDELQAFRARLNAYSRGAPSGQKSLPYAGFIDRIEEISALEPRDRIGTRLRGDGFTEIDDFADGRTFILDIELWDFGRRDLRVRKLDQVADYIEARGGQVYDRYVGPSITMLRAQLDGAVIRTLLAIEDLASLDSPPVPDVETDHAMDIVLADLAPSAPVADDAPVIGVIDSGLNAHPLLADLIVGAIGVPPALGGADDCGHGTRVAGIAVYGDLRAHLDAGQFQPAARLASAKVVNAQGRFDERRLAPSQMREALTSLHQRFGCRIFVVSLGDPKQVFDGGKVGPWAATLDELARELDAVIVVSAGNRAPRSGTRLEQAVTQYPRYLLEPANRLCEPAGAANVLTIGSLAQGEGIGPDLGEDVHVQPITAMLEPSPFSRIGPGVGGAIKPELVDVGGTAVFDPVTLTLQRGEERATAGVLTLHHRFLERLFTCGSGTSYSAPRVANTAARLLTRFPNASANLVRALLANASEVPEEARTRLAPLGEEAVRQVCGYGRPDVERASYSDDHRVVFYAEGELPLDHFAVYQVPIPEPFHSEGRRTIRVSLAYDPPVRHTRADYTGVGMSFRLIRGCAPDLIFEHYRRRTKLEGGPPEMPSRFNCGLEPGPRGRECGTLQSASVRFSRATHAYGDDYYLVVRCQNGWASSLQTSQRFAVVVELCHQQQVQLLARLRARLRI